jgi:hypothetical protein
MCHERTQAHTGSMVVARAYVHAESTQTSNKDEQQKPDVTGVADETLWFGRQPGDHVRNNMGREVYFEDPEVVLHGARIAKEECSACSWEDRQGVQNLIGDEDIRRVRREGTPVHVVVGVNEVQAIGRLVIVCEAPKHALTITRTLAPHLVRISLDAA